MRILVCLLFACLCVYPWYTRASVLPTSGPRSLTRLQARRQFLQEEADKLQNGEKDAGTNEGKALAEYMINELKKNTPHEGSEVSDLKSNLQTSRDSRHGFIWFCYYFPHYCYGCPSHKFECSDGTCIPGYWECDRWNDCGDASDEVNCVCASDEFTCGNGRCIPDYWQCDYDNDCGDFSDEEGCFADSTPSVPSSAATTLAPTSTSSPACGWGDWTEWSECNTGCGAGQRHRTRLCLCEDDSLCNGETTEYEMCELATCMPEAGSGCGSRHPQGTVERIVGGNDAVRGAWPWYAQLLFRGSFTCGGSLVQNKFIVTAAHCVEGNARRNPANWQVILGKHSTNDNSGDEYYSGVSEVIVHANYDSDTLDNDIAILVLADPPILPSDDENQAINSVCLDTSDAAIVDDSLVCFIAGFGTTREGGGSPTVLQEAEVPIVDRDRCNRRRSYNGDVTENMLCAGFMAGGVDSCQGDSGGPLVCSRRSRDDVTDTEVERWYLVGITSWGNGCARRNYPGVYTNVAKYTQWIQNIIAAQDGSIVP